MAELQSSAFFIFACKHVPSMFECLWKHLCFLCLERTQSHWESTSAQRPLTRITHPAQQGAE